MASGFDFPTLGLALARMLCYDDLSGISSGYMFDYCILEVLKWLKLWLICGKNSLKKKKN